MFSLSHLEISNQSLNLPIFGLCFGAPYKLPETLTPSLQSIFPLESPIWILSKIPFCISPLVISWLLSIFYNHLQIKYIKSVEWVISRLSPFFLPCVTRDWLSCPRTSHHREFFRFFQFDFLFRYHRKDKTRAVLQLKLPVTEQDPPFRRLVW